MSPTDRDVVAQLYLDSYPPEVGAHDLASALDEMTATFTGEYGELRTAASLVARIDNTPAGAIFTTSQSIWDPDLNGPFIIDLFVDPTYRGAGVGRALVIEAIKACVANQDTALSLRVGEGTSPQAYSLYACLGFLPTGNAST
jgi:GNAT superfamily N-acetyltransferase